MNVSTESYVAQHNRWPQAGRHILAQFDDETILVYQAYSEEIGRHAVRHGRFGGAFKYSRMSWIKPNFLWMMYRSSWGRSPNQEFVLALRLRRSFFDSLLDQAVASSFVAGAWGSELEWKEAVEKSDVRLQWDPDHSPTGEKCERRAIQLGLRNRALEEFGQRELVEVIDMTAFVAEQRPHAATWPSGRLITPDERVYVPTDPGIAEKLGLDSV